MPSTPSLADVIAIVRPTHVTVEVIRECNHPEYGHVLVIVDGFTQAVVVTTDQYPRRVLVVDSSSMMPA